MTYQAITVRGLSEDENEIANTLLARLDHHLRRNLVRSAIYDGKRKAKQVSSVLPAQYAGLGMALGWGAKAVDLLSLRCNLEGFTLPGGDVDALGVTEIYDANMLGAEVRHGTDASLIHSTAFVTTTFGQPGEPKVLWQFHSATRATGAWNARSRQLESLIVVTDYDTDNKLSGFVLYLPDVVITCSRGGRGWAVVDRQEHSWGIPADPLPYGSRLDRPFGRSRITRPMISLQDAAIRELLRLEGHMDAYSWPEFWLLGADPSILTNSDGMVQTSWETMMGRIKGIPDDPAGNEHTARADVKRFEAASPQPHLASLNAYAKLFAREASLPDSALAMTDLANPTSADAYDASQNDLIAYAEGATDGWSPYLRRSMIRSLGMAHERDGWDQVPAEWMALNTQWRDPRFTSRAAHADAGAKQVGAVPWLGETEVGLELLGLDHEQRRRALAEKDRAQAESLAMQVVKAARGNSPVEA